MTGILVFSLLQNSQRYSSNHPDLQVSKQQQPVVVQKSDETVPAYVLETLHHITVNGKAPENYVGGRNFQNRERRLRKTDSTGQLILYKEWDVHPKVKGKSRGAERLITGSDQSAYYTKDHYKSFIQIK